MRSSLTVINTFTCFRQRSLPVILMHKKTPAQHRDSDSLPNLTRSMFTLRWVWKISPRRCRNRCRHATISAILSNEASKYLALTFNISAVSYWPCCTSAGSESPERNSSCEGRQTSKPLKTITSKLIWIFPAFCLTAKTNMNHLQSARFLSKWRQWDSISSQVWWPVPERGRLW